MTAEIRHYRIFLTGMTTEYGTHVSVLFSSLSKGRSSTDEHPRLHARTWETRSKGMIPEIVAKARAYAAQLRAVLGDDLDVEVVDVIEEDVNLGAPMMGPALLLFTPAGPAGDPAGHGDGTTGVEDVTEGTGTVPSVPGQHRRPTPPHPGPHMGRVDAEP